MSAVEASRSSSDRGSGPLVPEGWSAFGELVCGFGDRHASAPAGTRLLERQVHGARVVHAAASPLAVAGTDALPRVAEHADALVADRPGLVAGVRTADCVPLLLVAPERGWAAAVHAGWRGTLAGIATEAVREAGRAGVAPSHLLAALGPSIGPCCYEVSDELAQRFAEAGLAAVATRPTRHGAGPHLDLRAANRLLLESAGLAPANIQDIGPCTRCAKDRYHSYRAEPGSEGRQVSWIGWEARRRPRDPARPR